MTIIYYDLDMPRDTMQVVANKIRESIGDEVLFLPKNFDVMLRTSPEQLLAAKNMIEAALALQEIKAAES